MLAPKPPAPAADISDRKQLELLYARRTVIDALIATLQVYDRFPAQSAPDRERQSV
jgi:hypothetical protein